MVFSTVPAYLDHHNWHQQPNHQEGSVGQSSELIPPLPPPQVVRAAGGSIRPGPMVDRAQLAKLALPEAGLNCPRCDSTNTKFCYFNNYSLTQPRHFCKTCRRYWTRGGGLRSVPVGGGCRRNKRSKIKNSKTPNTNGCQTSPNNSTIENPTSCSSEMTSHFSHSSTQLPSMAALQNLSHFGGGNTGGFHSQMVLTGGGSDMRFQLGGNLGVNNSILPTVGWLFPYEQHINFLAYQGGGVETPFAVVGDSHLRLVKTSSEIAQVAPVKAEENRGGLNSSRQLLGNTENNQYSWTDFPSQVNSSSTSHFL